MQIRQQLDIKFKPPFRHLLEKCLSTNNCLFTLDLFRKKAWRARNGALIDTFESARPLAFTLLFEAWRANVSTYMHALNFGNDNA